MKRRKGVTRARAFAASVLIEWYLLPIHEVVSDLLFSRSKNSYYFILYTDYGIFHYYRNDSLKLQQMRAIQTDWIAFQHSLCAFYEESVESFYSTFSKYHHKPRFSDQSKRGLTPGTSDGHWISNLPVHWPGNLSPWSQ